MTTTHDDLPHPVPPIAFLRWKENWFFIIMDPDRGVHGVVHLNFEPGHDRARFACHLSVQGTIHKYTSETQFPEEFAFARVVTDGRMSLRFAETPRRFDLALDSDDLAFELLFEGARPTFDFAACRSANPLMPSFQEVMTLGTNLPYNHQQQAMTVRGSVRAAGRQEDLAISGYAYRDHSWCVRTDNVVMSHTWSGIHFGSRAFGVKKLHTLSRPDVWAREGYVSDEDGERALTGIEVIHEGEAADGLPREVRFELADVFGRRYTVRCDVAGRHAQVPLVAEKPGRTGAYSITENFCPAVLVETGEKGCALVELGAASR
jgi:hypothetical protein